MSSMLPFSNVEELTIEQKQIIKYAIFFLI